MYSFVDEVRLMLKDHVLETFLSNDFYDITDPLEKEVVIVSVVQDAIDDADAEINGYLAKRYPTPLLVTPAVINKYSKDIAIYNLASRSGMKSDERENNYYVRYKNAIRYLEAVAKGIVEITTGSGLEDSGKTSALTSNFKIQSSEKLFGRQNMKGY